MKQLLTIILLCTGMALFAHTDTTICYLEDEGGRIRERNVDFTKMLLDVKFKPKDGIVMGNVKYDFQPIHPTVDTLFLDAPAINIKKVLLNGKETPFTTNKDGLTIRFANPLTWNAKYKLDITYEATPRKGIYFIGWNDSTNLSRKQIWTQGQGIDNRYWFPCFDDVTDKLITETKITFDKAYTVISNGVAKEVRDNGDGTKTWYYGMNKPMQTYLVMIAIDKYAYKDYTSKNGRVSRQYYYADRPETAEPMYRYSAEMMDWLPAEFGVPYPWQSYCNVPVQDYMYGAMENTTATIFTDFYCMDKRQVLERPYLGTNAHELTHQWFGDMITEYSAQHHWLHESFATYYAKMFRRKVLGDDWYQWEMRSEASQAIGADSRDRYPIAHSKGGSPRHYPKGSNVIGMIRYVVGDSIYRRTITNYLKKHAFENVSNEDFKMAFMETAGINLDWFFNQWIYRAGVPTYEVTVSQMGGVTFNVNQTHKVDELTGYFKMPIVFEIHAKDGRVMTKREWVDGPETNVRFDVPTAFEIDYALFDPGSNILKNVKFEKSYEQLVAQANKAANMIDRYDAIVAMRAFDLSQKRADLIALFNKPNFHEIKEEIVRQITDDDAPESIEMLKKALADSDFQVRRSVIDNSSKIPESLLPAAEKLLYDTSYYTIENTLRKLTRLYPQNKQRYLEETKGVQGVNKNVRIIWLELVVKDLRPEEKNMSNIFVKELVNYSSQSYEFKTRVKAMESIERLQLYNADVIQNLFNAVCSPNGRLNGPATTTLKSLIKDDMNKADAIAIYKSLTLKDWQSEIIAKMLGV
jgi:aminopeptidase N